MNCNDTKNRLALGLALGLLGIVISMTMGLLCGFIGGSIGLVLGIVAIILGFRTRRERKSNGAINTGFMAIFLSVIMVGASIEIMNIVHAKALESDQAPIIAEYGKNPYFGLAGLVWKTTSNGETLEKLRREIEIVNATFVK